MGVSKCRRPRSTSGISTPRRRASALHATETEEINGIAPWMNAASAWAQVVPWLESDRLDATREGSSAHEEIDVGGPHRTLDDRVVACVTNEVT